MVTKHDGNFEKTACESPDSQQLQLGNADYDVNIAVQYRHQLQILIYDEWTLLQMAMSCNSKLLHKIHEKKNYLFLTKNPIVLHTKSIKRPSLCHPSLVLVHVNLT